MVVIWAILTTKKSGVNFTYNNNRKKAVRQHPGSRLQLPSRGYQTNSLFSGGISHQNKLSNEFFITGTVLEKRFRTFSPPHRQRRRRGSPKANPSLAALTNSMTKIRNQKCQLPLQFFIFQCFFDPPATGIHKAIFFHKSFYSI